MAQELPAPGDFSVDLQWPANPEKGGVALLDGSLGRLGMLVSGTSLTSYQTDAGVKASHITVPLYHLVNWLAHNWWAFLYEPRKLNNEEGEKDFRTRHWLGAAREGFVLPDVMFSPAGGNTEVIARPSYLRFAQLTFLETVSSIVTTENVRAQFTSLIDSVLQRLGEKGIKDSDAHHAWSRVKDTDNDQEAYCRLIGSMGLSPYVDHPDIDKGLEVVADRITETMMVDLCEATNVRTFQRAADVTSAMSAAMEKSEPIGMEPLLAVGRPSDGVRPAYEWGYRASDAARRSFGIAADDPDGSKVFFDKIGFKLDAPQEPAPASPIVGALKVNAGKMKLSLGPTDIATKKFGAARASFLAWSKGENNSRLVTTARTRDQQASRAFAAEILAPAKYLEKRLGKGVEVSPFQLDKIASEIGVAPTVVRYQAQNHGYEFSEAA